MNRKRIVSLLLALLMIFSMIPYSAFAESEVTDEEAASFEETLEISEDHPEAEIIVEDAEQDDLTAEAAEETAEEEQPAEESEDEPSEEENAKEMDAEEGNTEDADIEQDNSISDNSDPIEDEGEWTEEDETAEPEEPADEDAEDDPQDDPQDEEQSEELSADDPAQEQSEPSVEYADPWDEAISLIGHAYGRTKGETSVYEDADLKGDPIFIISQEDGILLVTEYREQNSQKILLVWCLSEDDIITGYVLCNALKDNVITDDADIAELRLLYDAFPVRTNAGDLYAFHVEGYKSMHESGVTEDIPDDEMLIDTDDPSTDPDEETAPEEEVTDNEPEQETDSLDEPDPLDEPNQEEVYSITIGQIDEYIAVTTNTRAFMTMDESASDTYDGDYCLGYFVRDAVVQIAAIEQDEQGRAWYQVRYMFGDTYTDGSLKWTDYGFTWVLAQDTGETDAEACTLTDYALTTPPVKKKGMLKAATPTYGFSLRTAYGTMGSFYVGQYPLYGSSGSDSAYKQIAKLSGHGAVYATPHYLEGVPVYCLEHTYPGPGENKSSGGKQPTGPYIIVDIDSYMYNPGYSRIIYNKSTLHAIAWVLRHTYVKKQNAKKYRQGKEYGSARWGGPEDIKPFIDPVFRNNVILTQTERLTMASKVPNPAYARNKNVLVVGGSGSGKTRFFLKPNLMQLHSSYVVTDPKGTVLIECGKLLQRAKYQIKVFNTINFAKSMHYNPFAYIHSEKDVLKLVNTLIANTKGEGKSGDDFWVKAETLLYTALISYIMLKAPNKEKNFFTLIKMISAMETREDDEDYKNHVDQMFDELEKEDPNHFAVRQYRKFKLAAGKTAKSVLISCAARLAPFDIQEVRDVTAYDEMALDTIGDQKTAVFFIISDTDDSFNFLISMAYTQMFNLLCEKADDHYGGKLPVHVRCLIDEMANIGQIPKLEKLVATIRSREISACLILQTQSQLKAIYKDNADTIIGNMDSVLFLGGKEKTTLKDMAETLGKETIDTYNTGESRGRETSHSLNYQKLGKELMSVDELAVMDGSQCILQLRGVRPFLSKKYDITKHPNYKYLSDADPKNAFNIEEFIACRLKVKENDQYETFEVDGDEDEPILQGNPEHPETETSGIEAEDDPFDYAALY